MSIKKLSFRKPAFLAATVQKKRDIHSRDNSLLSPVMAPQTLLEYYEGNPQLLAYMLFNMQAAVTRRHVQLWRGDLIS